MLIGPSATLERLERQLDLLPDRPLTIGWVLTGRETAPGDRPVLGPLDDLEAIVARRRPTLALVSMPAVMRDAVTHVRTRLRRLGVPDRFVPTLEDLVAGIGPRTYLDVDLAALLDRPPRALDPETGRVLLAGRRVLVTGAGGSIGSELSRMIAATGPERLVLMDRAENPLFEIDRQIARRFPDLARHAVLHDVVDTEGTLAHCRRHEPEIIFHAAAHKHVPMMEDHPAAALDNNLFGTRSIVDAALATGARRFVMISTDKAVRPTSIMGATKRLAELYVQHVNRRSNTACSMVRFGNVLGSSGSVLEIWSRELAAGGPLTVTDPEMTRYFMTIPEAAALVIESAALVDPDAADGEVFVLDMGEPVRILDMAQRFIRMHGLEPGLAAGRRPGSAAPGVMPIVFTGARPGEKLHEELALPAEELRPTRHPDISIRELAPPDDACVDDLLANLAPDVRPRDPRHLAEAIRRQVPESAEAAGV
ncbi:MAG: polysaccharide biosynthesis protein [Planctomycetes bacterium]|nr:polysaccharide biosynthesis protein [Planctomycetota bacterium]